MNCKELEADIEKLKELKEKIERFINGLSEIKGDDVLELGATFREVNGFEDEALNKYSREIIANNPDIFEPSYEIKETIDGFLGYAQSVLELPDGSFLVGGGTNGGKGDKLKLLSKENGSFEYGKAIEGFTSNYITQTILLPSGDILVGGTDDCDRPNESEIRILHKDSNGGFSFGEKIELEGDESELGLSSMSLLPNGDVVVGYGNPYDWKKGGQLRILRKDDAGDYKFVESSIRSTDYAIGALLSLPDGRIMMAPADGLTPVEIMEETADDELSVVGSVENTEDYCGMTLQMLPDGNVLLGDDSGSVVLLGCSKKDGAEYWGQENDLLVSGDTKALLCLPNNEIIVGGEKVKRLVYLRHGPDITSLYESGKIENLHALHLKSLSDDTFLAFDRKTTVVHYDSDYSLDGIKEKLPELSSKKLTDVY